MDVAAGLVGGVSGGGSSGSTGRWSVAVDAAAGLGERDQCWTSQRGLMSAIRAASFQSFPASVLAGEPAYEIYILI